MTNLSEREELEHLIEGFLSGRASEHRQLREQVRQYVARRYGADRSGHEDIVSEIINSLLVNLREKRFRGENLRTFSAYVFGIARLQIQQAIKASDRARARRGDSGAIDDLPDGTPGEAHEKVLNLDFVERILRALEGECRELLVLKFQKGWSDGEIAEHKNKSKNAISTAISRCVKKAKGLEFVKELLY